MKSFYAFLGMAMVVAAIAWYVSPRSRRKIRRLAFMAGLAALFLALVYNYSHKDEATAPTTPAAEVSRI